jgi:2'-hydroxyisoflavone reductase
MKLLVLGGTRFLGRHIVEQALAAGHQVTLVHRGRSGPALFPQAEHRLGDRDGDLSVLQGGAWDVCIDTSAYVPRQVRSVAQALAGRVGAYQLVSTISVYAAFDELGLAENAPLAQLADPTVEAITGETYGGLKALCEAAAFEGFGERCLVSRPGLLVGPHDPTGRFTWWAERLARAAAGGEVLAPGDPQGPVQCIDARDAATWHLLQAQGGTTGVFNLTGPSAPTTMAAWLEAGRQALAPAAHFTWVDEGFLLGAGVAPWSDLPVWLPRASAGLHQVSIARALAAGLSCRPLAQTWADTAAWAPQAAPVPAGGPPRPPVGLSAEREQALLAGWHQAHPSA